MIVFKAPNDPKKNFVKRIVGMPNETAEIKEGKILVNDSVVEDKSSSSKIHYYNKGEDYTRRGKE